METVTLYLIAEDHSIPFKPLKRFLAAFTDKEKALSYLGELPPHKRRLPNFAEEVNAEFPEPVEKYPSGTWIHSPSHDFDVPLYQ